MNVGSTVYTCMLNKNGGVESDLTVSMIKSGSGGPYAPTFSGKLNMKLGLLMLNWGISIGAVLLKNLTLQIP